MGGLVEADTDAPAGDYNLPGNDQHRELTLLVRAGLIPVAALHAATSEAGKILGRPDLGTLHPSSMADVLIRAGDPATNIRAARNVRSVLQAGRGLSIDSLLRQVTATANTGQ